LIRDLCCWVCALFFFVLGKPAGYAQGTAPTFSYTAGQQAYTLLGHDPAQAVSTTIPTVLVPIELSFAAKARDGKPFVMAAAPDVRRILSSPVFSRFAFSPGNKTQYGDALLRATFPNERGWHTRRRRRGPPSPSSMWNFCSRQSSSSCPGRRGNSSWQ
jgi:hypothetical protein